MILGHPHSWWILLLFLIGLFAFVCGSVGYLLGRRHIDQIRHHYRTQSWRPDR